MTIIYFDFVIRAYKKKVHKICCGSIMRYLELKVNRILSFKDISFCHFRELIDTEMKQLQREGVGS